MVDGKVQVELRETPGLPGEHGGEQRRAAGQLAKQVPAQSVDQHDRDAIDLAGSPDPVGQRQLVDGARRAEQRGDRGQHVAEGTGHWASLALKLDTRQSVARHAQLTVRAVGEGANLPR